MNVENRDTTNRNVHPITNERESPPRKFTRVRELMLLGIAQAKMDQGPRAQVKRMKNALM
jgi:hypothetical protein